MLNIYHEVRHNPGIHVSELLYLICSDFLNFFMRNNFFMLHSARGSRVDVSSAEDVCF